MNIPVIGKNLPKPKIKSEHLEQVEFIQWMRRTHPNHRIFAIPNGGLRSKSVAMQMKAEGVTAGVPDLFVPSLKAFIEMKRSKGGQVSETQQDWLSYLKSVGYQTKVCNGKDEAIAFIEEIVVAFKK
jgi:hypothetical protein